MTVEEDVWDQMSGLPGFLEMTSVSLSAIDTSGLPSHTVFVDLHGCRRSLEFPDTFLLGVKFSVIDSDT